MGRARPGDRDRACRRRAASEIRSPVRPTSAGPGGCERDVRLEPNVRPALGGGAQVVAMVEAAEARQSHSYLCSSVSAPQAPAVDPAVGDAVLPRAAVAVRFGLMPKDRIVATIWAENVESPSKMRGRAAESRGNASRSSWMTHAAEGWSVTSNRRTRRRSLSRLRTDVQDPEVHRRDREEVHRGDHIAVVPRNTSQRATASGRSGCRGRYRETERPDTSKRSMSSSPSILALPRSDSPSPSGGRGCGCPDPSVAAQVSGIDERAMSSRTRSPLDASG
jgi:hypothetical protein